MHICTSHYSIFGRCRLDDGNSIDSVPPKTGEKWAIFLIPSYTCSWWRFLWAPYKNKCTANQSMPQWKFMQILLY